MLLFTAVSWGQVALGTGTSYNQNFDGMSTGTTIPSGWTVRTGASASSAGTTQSLSTNAVGATTGAFNNFPSSLSGGGRALGVRQTGSFGDPGAAFMVSFTNTTGKEDFSLSINHQTMSEQPRATVWTVQYSIVATGASGWTNLGTWTTGTSQETKTYTIPAAFENISTNVHIRIVTLAASTGSGNRDSSGIDNFVLSWTNASTTTAPTVSTNTTATSVTADTAATGGNVTAAGTASVTARGIVWTTSTTDATITTNMGITTDGSGTGTFTSNLTGLTPDTLYYYRAYATSTAGTSYGTEYSFTTQSIPTVATTNPATGITINSANAGGNVTAQGTSAVSARGVVWTTSSSTEPTITTNSGITTDGTGTGTFTSAMTGLSVSTTYYYRAYATNTQGTAYGTKYSFTTLSIVAPTVTTTTFNAQDDAGVNTANLKGGVTNDGGAAIVQRGFIWNTSDANLILGEATTVDDTDDTDAAFTTAISGLTANAQYYYRAFARNSTATGYGTINNFYTKAATPGAPTVNNATVNSLTVTNDANGNPTATEYVVRIVTPVGTRYVNSLGGVTDTEVWLAGSTLASQLVVTGLSAGTSYTFDVKARNASGIETPYSNTTTELTASPSTPYFTLIGSDLEFGPLCINTTSQAGYFTFQANNVPVGQQIAVYSLEGFSYSLTEGGTYQNGLFFNNTGSVITVYVKFTPSEVQPYPEELNGVPGTIGVNSNNTSTLNIPVFGEGVNTPAIAVTGANSNITAVSATLAGQLTQGCSAITAYGTEYSTTPDFAGGTGTQVAGSNLASGSFTVAVTGLAACTTYYYKAYATDATGTYHGMQDTFTTGDIANPTATDASAIAQTSFTANWDAVPGATGYYLDVSTSPDFETVFVTEDFSTMVAPVPPASDSNIASSLNTYTDTPGWTGQFIYQETGYARVGTSSGQGNIATPSLNLTTTGGAATISFRAKHNAPDTTNKTIRVLYSANGGTNYVVAPVAEFTLTDNFATYSTPYTGGNATTKFRIQALTATANRFQIDDIKVTYSQMLAGYNNLAVTTGTSHEVTGLNPDTKYYYRVRAYGANCTSANSNTIEIETLKYLTAGTTDLAFGDVCTNATDTGSFTFTGANMTDATLNIAALSGYTYSLTENGEYTSTLQITDYDSAETTIYVKFTPTAAQAYNGNIVIQGAAPYATATLTVPVTGAGIFTAAVATADAATAISMTSASISATSTTGNCTTNTGYGVEYSTTNNFTNGTGIQVAGAGIDSEGAYMVMLESLLPCKTYYYKAYTTTSGAPVYSAQRSFTTDAIESVEALDGTDVTDVAFTANWETSANAAGYRIDVSTSPEFGTGNFGTELIISEYIEGTSNNKALEIYNGTGAAIPDLSIYSLRQQQNGAGAFGSSSSYIFTFPAVSLPAGSVYILKSDQASALTTAPGHPAGLTTALNFSASGGPTVHFTGNDAIGLFKGSTMIDVIGVVNGGAGNVWGAERTMTRNASVLSPSATYTASQWTTITSPTNSSGLGAHTYDGGLLPSFVEGYENLNVPGSAIASVEITGLEPFTKYYYRVRAYTTDCTTANSEVIEVSTKGTVTWKLVGGTAQWVPAFYEDGITPLVIDETVDTAIETDYDTAVNGGFTPKSVTITSGVFTVAAGTTFTVEDDIINNAAPANFVVENNGNLIQNKSVNNNTGAITVERDSSPLFRNDYVMWSSPVAGQALLAFSPNTAAGRYYAYSPEPGENAGQENGTYVDATGSFETGKGYLIRMPNAGYNYDTQSATGTINGTAAQYNNGAATMVFNGKFTGVPNNGDIPVTISNLAGSYNLIGNPYPSPLNLPAFLAENDDVITGTVYVWRKKNASSGTSAYVTMNSTGQYTDNGEPNTGTDPIGVIRTGQGFIVQTTENPTASQVLFNNTMRSDDTANQFFRNVNGTQQIRESHGVYLNLTNTAGLYSQMYTGYVAGATEGRDNGIDAEYINDKPTLLSTQIGGKEYIIQGRALPFNAQNTEPLQLRAATAGQYTIAVDRTEGSFATQDIYLQDNMLNIVHNIKESPYAFTTAAGTFANRFEIVYSPDGTLATENPVANENSIVIFKQDNVLKINSTKEDIADVTVFDIRGRKLYEAADVNAAATQTTDLQSEQQVLIVKIKTVNGSVISKKVIF